MTLLAYRPELAIALADDSHPLSDAVREQLRGVLESADAYFAWLARTGQTPLDEDEECSVAAVIEKVQGHVARGELALNAIESIFAETPGAVPQAVPILAELADNCWTEVEDVFLSLAEDDEDDGETVPSAD